MSSIIGRFISAVGVLIFLLLSGCQSTTSVHDTRLSGHRFQNDKPWGYQFVSEPVRAGDVAQRFEVRAGDCGYTRSREFSDCDSGNERSEFELNRLIPFPGDVWIGWSVFLPRNFANGPNLFQSKIFQLKFRDGPSRVEENSSDTFTQLVNLQVERDGDVLTLCLYRFQRTAKGWRDRCDKSRLVPVAAMRGKWTDILINYNSQGTGNLTVFINGTPRATERDFVSFDSDSVYAAYGIYRPVGAMSGSVPTQVVYVDEMRIGSTRESVEIAVDHPVD